MARSRSTFIVSFSDVSLRLDGKKVLSHIDWTVRPGQNWVVIGPNSAGKTSLMSIVNGYRWPSSGKAAVLGRRFGESDLRELKKEIGFVSSYVDQIASKEQKVIEFVLSGIFGSTRMWRKAKPSDVAAAEEALDDLRCSGLSNQALSKLSQGERQKVAIARALAGRPKLLVLDEPCEGLDLSSRESVLKGLSSLLSRRRGPAIIEVTHRTEDIPRGFTHALLLREGRIVASGKIGSTLTSSKLSRCLGTPVDLRTVGGRYYMLAKSEYG